MTRVLAVVAIFILTSGLLVGSVAAEENNLKAGIPTEQAVSSSSSQQIKICIQLIELSRTKMQRLGVDLQIFDGASVNKYSGTELLDPTFVAESTTSGLFVATLDALCKNGVAKILTAPTVVTLVGQTASLSSGKKLKLKHGAVDTSFVGTKLDVTPHLVEDNRVRIDLRLKWSEVASQSKSNHTDTPVIAVREVDTTFEAEIGKRFTLTGLTSKSGHGSNVDESCLLLTVTPILVNETAATGRAVIHYADSDAFRIKNEAIFHVRTLK